jgi:hypothetical protein
MICSGDQLFILGTRKLRQSRLISKEVSINISVSTIMFMKESLKDFWYLKSRMILPKNDLTEGLLTKLSKRVGIFT